MARSRGYRRPAPLMASKIDEFSRVLGGLESSTKSLSEDFKQHIVDDDDRHRENIATMRQIGDQVREVNAIVTPLAATIKAWTPILASYQVTRWKMAGAVTVAVAVLSVVGWLLQVLIIKALSWALGMLIVK